LLWRNVDRPLSPVISAQSARHVTILEDVEHTAVSVGAC
jgi:hypothetical protein